MNRTQRSHIGTTSNVIDRAKSVLRGLKRQSDLGSVNTVKSRRELCSLIANLERLEEASGIPVTELKNTIRLLKETESCLQVQPDAQPSTTIDVDPADRLDLTEPNGFGTGRPKVTIDMEKLNQLLQLGFSIQQIAKNGLLGGVVHPNTLYKRLNEDNKAVRSNFTSMDDDSLKNHIRDYNRRHPNAGSEDVHGHLRSIGINVQRERCRQLLREIDSVGTATRWSTTTSRRKYSVPYANFLWHLDTHHSLKRWGMVVHGGIDGFSRMITFLRTATTNSAKSAAAFFIGGTDNFGIPSRVRADHGTEFVDVGRIIQHVNGNDRGSFLVGPSVHNQRIERLWRDVFVKVIDPFYKLFCYMEEMKLLDVADPVHMFVLQFTFGPRIDQSCKEWMEAHNHHKVRTEHNQSPHMLWFQSLLTGKDSTRGMMNISQPPVDSLSEILSELNITRDVENFLLPRFNCPLLNEKLEEMKESIIVTRPSASNGLDVFGEVLDFVRANNIE